MASVVCRVQFLDDMDPFVCTNFPEPRRPPPYTLYEDISLIEQVAGVHKLLESPLKLEDCALQLSPSGNYLDLDLTLSEQKDDLEQFYEDIGKGKKPVLILRTQLSVRVHAILVMKTLALQSGSPCWCANMLALFIGRSKVRIGAWAGLDPSPCCGEVESSQTS
ncbi:UNVERIFIED_CONTAM: hypothetical protein FKN15_074263 [Acipenser sinensis]